MYANCKGSIFYTGKLSQKLTFPGILHHRTLPFLGTQRLTIYMTWQINMQWAVSFLSEESPGTAAAFPYNARNQALFIPVVFSVSLGYVGVCFSARLILLSRVEGYSCQSRQEDIIPSWWRAGENICQKR